MFQYLYIYIYIFLKIILRTLLDLVLNGGFEFHQIALPVYFIRLWRRTINTFTDRTWDRISDRSWKHTENRSNKNTVQNDRTFEFGGGWYYVMRTIRDAHHLWTRISDRPVYTVRRSFVFDRLFGTLSHRLRNDANNKSFCKRFLYRTSLIAAARTQTQIDHSTDLRRYIQFSKYSQTIKFRCVQVHTSSYVETTKLTRLLNDSFRFSNITQAISASAKWLVCTIFW